MTEAIANTEQAEYWNSDEARHWVEHEERYNRILAAYTPLILKAAALGPDDRVLDVGCGCGATTRAAAQIAASAVGLDLSGPMLEAGRRRAEAEGITNVEFRQGDAQVEAFEAGSFDVVISRFGVMFFADPAAAFANIATALRPGGRVAFACWQDALANEWIIVPGMAVLNIVPMPDLGAEGPGPFSLADAGGLRSLLEGAGFTGIAIDDVHESGIFGDDPDDTLEFFRDTGFIKRILADHDPETGDRVLAAVRDAAVPYQTDQGVRFQGAAWLVTATR